MPLLLATLGSDRRGRERSQAFRVPLLWPQPRSQPERPREVPVPEFVQVKGKTGAQKAELPRAVHPKQGGFPAALPGCGLSLLQRAGDGSARRQQGRRQANSIGGT